MSRVGLLSLQLLVAVVGLALWQLLATVPILGTASEAVGAAFRLRIGEHSALLHNGDVWADPTP